MASGGWEFGTASGKLQGKISWSSSSNGSSANTSNITAILYARRVDGYTTTGQSWSGYVKIQGKDNSSQTNISFDHSVSIGGSWVEVARTTLNNAKHNDDGSGSATVSGSVTGPSGTNLSGITSSGSSGITLDKIARYTSIKSFTVSKRDETSLTFNWQTADTVDYVWYSTNNGSNWTGVDVTDGTSGSFNVTGLSVGGTYNCKIRVRRKDSQLTTDSALVSAKTNTAPTTQINSYTETTATVKWTSDGTSNHIWYSVDNGSWVDAGNVNATTGTYTVSGLTVNKDHNIKTRVRKSNTSNTYDSSAASFKTYNWPSCTSAPDFTIGNSVKLDFYNPLNRTMSIRMWSHVKQDFVTDAINVTGTTYTFTPNASTLYASIPNNTSSTYNIDVTYSGNKYVKTGGKYSINATTSKPTFTNNFGLKDTTVNDLTTAIGNNQILVQNVSNVNLTIASANKMVANNSATPRDYSILFGNLNKSAIAYTTNDLDANVGVITSTGNITATVVAYDSRGSNTQATKSFNVIQYNAPRIDISGIQRVNNYETETHVKIAGTFDKVTVGNEDKNLIKLVRFRYKESTSQTWESWTEMSMHTQGSGSYETNTVTLQLDNTKQFNFQIEVTDRAKTTTTNALLNVGEPLMFLHTNGNLEVQNGIYSTKGCIGLYKELDLSSLPNTNFYPCTFNITDFEIDCEIHSPNVGSGNPYNQNVIHFKLLAQGWSDTPQAFQIITYGAYTNTEITIGSIGIGNQGGVNCVWLRGGMLYRIRSNANITLHTTDYTNGNEKFTVGTNYYGGSNANVTIVWTPQSRSNQFVIRSELFNLIYPVGAIYMSAVNTSPANLFGGTWVQLKSRFIYATGANEGSGGAGGKDNVSTGTGTSTISQSTSTTGQSSGSTGKPSNNSTGGVTLTAAQSGLRQHKHTVTGNYAKDVSKQNIWGSPIWSNSDGSWCGQYSGVSVNDVSAANATSSHSHTLSDHTHSLNNHTHSYSHTHGISYIAVYVWQRTA